MEEGRSKLLAYDGEWPPPEQERPPPTAPDPPPPELIPDDSQAIAVCTSPDVCRAPKDPVPFMVWGKGDDDQNYSPDVRSNGLRIKRADSKFTATYGDEPGTGLGVGSGTVGDVVEPVTSSPIVRANGIPVQRHADRCTLNNGNCPGEYVHVQSTETHEAPDGRDEDDRAWYEKLWEGVEDNSSTVQDAESIIDRAGDYLDDPSLIGDDLQSLWDSVPTAQEAWQGAQDIASGAADLATDVWNDPVGSAEAAGGWIADTATGIKDDVVDAYEQGGIAQAAGAVVGMAADVVSPSTKARAVKAGAEVADELGDAARRRRRHDGEEEEKAEEDGEDGARSTREEKPYSDPRKRPKYADGQVDDVWENAKDPNGKVYDPNTGEELTWDNSKPRTGQWDMEHKPGHEYRKLHDDYMSGRIDKDEFLRQYRDPSNYQPESVSGNRSHRYEED